MLGIATVCENDRGDVAGVLVRCLWESFVISLYALLAGTQGMLDVGRKYKDDNNVRAIAASCGFKAVVMWKGATNDGRLDLQDGKLLKPGDILLMHWRTDLLQNLQVVIAACKSPGFTVARLEDYLSPGT